MKRRRALLESIPLRNNRLELIDADERRERLDSTAPGFHLNIGPIDSPCLGKLMQHAAAQRPPCSELSVGPRTRPAADSRAPSAGVLVVDLFQELRD